MKDEASITAFAIEQGISADKFKAAYRSFAVNTQLERAKQQFVAYQLQGVPSVIVDGRYNVQLGAAGDNAMKVVDFLVKKAAAERKKPPAR
jgi:thiol:disulfide interchange protein DsbA